MPPVYHVERRLTDISSMYPPAFDALGPWFFPEKGTDYLSDKFAQHSKANMLGLRSEGSNQVGDDDLPQEVQVVYDADTEFTIPVYALSNPGKWISRRNADPALNYEATRALTLTSAMRVLLEYVRVNKRLRDNSQMTQNKTLLASERFDNPTSGDCAPVALFQQIALTIKNQNQGRAANRWSMASETLLAISNTPDFLGRVKFTQIADAEKISKEPNGIARLLEAMVGVASGTLRVHDAVYNAGSVSSPSYKKFIGSDSVMGYVEPAGLESYTLGIGWKWNAIPEETAIVSVPQFTRGAAVEDEFRILAGIEPQIVQPTLGYLVQGCVDVTNAEYNGFLD
jgi:hypothetical protein